MQVKSTNVNEYRSVMESHGLEIAQELFRFDNFKEYVKPNYLQKPTIFAHTFTRVRINSKTKEKTFEIIDMDDMQALSVNRSSVETLEAKKLAEKNRRLAELNNLQLDLIDNGYCELANSLTAEYIGKDGITKNPTDFNSRYASRILTIAYERISAKNAVITDLNHAYRSVWYAIRKFKVANNCGIETALQFMEEPDVKRYDKKAVARQLSTDRLSYQHHADSQYSPETNTIADSLAKEYVLNIKLNLSRTLLQRVGAMVKAYSELTSIDAKIAYIEVKKRYQSFYRLYAISKFENKSLKELSIGLHDFVYLLGKYW